MNEPDAQRMFNVKSAQIIARLPVLVCVFLTACYPPMVAPVRIKPVTGSELRAEPDTNVVTPGVTTWAEILNQFAPFDTGWRGERFFFGRWLRSGFVLNGGRIWDGRVFAVEFDKKGVVLRYQVLSDAEFLEDKGYWLSSSSKDPSSDHPTGYGLDVKRLNIEGRDIVYVGSISTHCVYRFPVEEFEGFSVWPYSSVYSPVSTDARQFGLSIRLKKKVYPDCVANTKDGFKTIRLDADVPSVVLLANILRIAGGKP